jgi:Na+/H+ antiporter NhaC
MEYGLLSIIPVLVVIACAIVTRKAAESLFVGTLVGALIFAIGENGFGETFSHPLVEEVGIWSIWFTTLTTTISENAYYVVMFGMFGAMIRLLDNSGSALGFADIGAKVASSRKKTMGATFILGIVIFIEDYLNALGVGIAMRSLSDKFKISREMLAFIVNSTGAAVCIIVPISSWGVLYSSQISETKLFEGMSGLSAYAQSIPFMLYTWVTLICVVLFILGIIPLFGPMKKAEQRALEMGRTYPDWYYEKADIDQIEEPKKSGWWNFVVPMLVLIAIAIITNDIVTSVIVSTVVGAIMLMIQKRLTLSEFADSIVDGFKDMLYVTILVLLAFALQKFNDNLGLTNYVIESVEPILSPGLFPTVAFVVVAIIAFCTGSFWGVAAISFPIILPLAQAMGVNLFLAVGAVTAATAFGSHACFYSDAVTVTAAATGIKNIDYAKTALPLIAVPLVISIIAYLVVGFVMAP